MEELKLKINSKEESIRVLKDVIKQIENDEYEGVLVYANHPNPIFIQSIKGNALDRIDIMDAIFLIILDEPIKESKHFMLSEMYKRWKHYFGEVFLNEMEEKWRLR